MTRFIPRDKLSKKARKRLDSQRRLTWTVSPASRLFESKKTYNRKRKSHELQDDRTRGIF